MRPCTPTVSRCFDVLLALATAAAFVGSADAAERRSGIVTSCSRFGHGCIAGTVRPAKFGAEVRLPGGTWIGCSGDCREKLREESIDFWDLHTPENGGRRRR